MTSLSKLEDEIGRIKERLARLESKKKNFYPPSKLEVELYLRAEKNIPYPYSEDIAENFISYYGMVGWIVGKGKKMVDWRLAAGRFTKRWKEDVMRDKLRLSKLKREYERLTSEEQVRTI